MAELLRRPELDYFMLAEIDPKRPELPHDTAEQVNINVKYEGYLKRQMQQVAQFKKLESKRLDPDFDYSTVNTYKTFYMPDTADQFDFSQYDYVVDAIDTVKGKLELVMQAQATGTPIISCMGAGNKLDASALEVADIYDTSVCPLARVMRAELRKRGVKHLKVVYSKEPALTPIDDMTISCGTHCICPPDTAHKCTQRRQVPGSNAFVPAAAGLIIAGEVVRDIANGEPQKK